MPLLPAEAADEGTGDEPLDVLAGLDEEREREVRRSRREAGTRAAAVALVFAAAEPARLWGGRVAMRMEGKKVRQPRVGGRREREK